MISLLQAAVFAFAVLSTLTAILLATRVRLLKQENTRLESNLRYSGERLTELKTLDGKRAYQNGVLALRVRELQSLYPEILQEVRNLRIDPSRTERIARSEHAYHLNVTTAVRDSITHDTVKVKVFSYRDPWYSIKGEARDSLQHLSISMRDTLVQVVYRGERERPWLWIFSPRKLQQRIVLKNPTAQVVYSDVIEVQRRRGKKP